MELRTMFFKNMSFEQQVVLMSSTDIVMGMHGAAFVNIMFMRPRSGFMEFFSPIAHNLYYENMARKTDLVYVGVARNRVAPSKRKIADGRNKNIIVDVNMVMRQFVPLVNDVFEQKYFLVS